MITRALKHVAQRCHFNSRGFASASAAEIEFDLGTPYKTHLCDGPATNTAMSSREELLGYLKEMNVIRRMEVACDNEYKTHDDWITSYRCHAASYLRGDSVESIMAEQFGFESGVVKGKGGSMHMYNKETNFWGGAAIVGAQVPIGAGLAFANKYNANHGGERMNVSMAFYGDGAANQGQCWEAANMALLWKLPALFVIENNMYGMGTSVERHSGLTEYYKQGGVVIPGIQVDGMDVLAVRECFKYAREWAATGNGPMFIEVKTYRYHGHSMYVLFFFNFEFIFFIATKSIEKDARKEVKEAVKAAKAGKELPLHVRFYYFNFKFICFVRNFVPNDFLSKKKKFLQYMKCTLIYSIRRFQSLFEVLKWKQVHTKVFHHYNNNSCTSVGLGLVVGLGLSTLECIRVFEMLKYHTYGNGKVSYLWKFQCRIENIFISLYSFCSI
eukprot:GSMAST32.ASY1.ANO1.1986.1 assembled CDS